MKPKKQHQLPWCNQENRHRIWGKQCCRHLHEKKKKKAQDLEDLDRPDDQQTTLWDDVVPIEAPSDKDDVPVAAPSNDDNVPVSAPSDDNNAATPSPASSVSEPELVESDTPHHPVHPTQDDDVEDTQAVSEANHNLLMMLQDTANMIHAQLIEARHTGQMHLADELNEDYIFALVDTQKIEVNQDYSWDQHTNSFNERHSVGLQSLEYSWAQDAISFNEHHSVGLQSLESLDD